MGPKEEAAVVQVEPEQKTKSVVEEVKEEEEKQSSWLGLFRGSRSSQPRDDTGGVYLDDIVNDPEKRALYLKPSQILIINSLLILIEGGRAFVAVINIESVTGGKSRVFLEVL